MTENNRPIKIVGKSVKIVRINPDNIRSVPVNDVTINHSKHEFYITFSSVEPPAIFDENEYDAIQNVEAFARAKFVMTPEFVDALIKALSMNLEQFNKESSDTNDPIF